LRENFDVGYRGDADIVNLAEEHSLTPEMMEVKK
jgi:hypothetical protein